MNIINWESYKPFAAGTVGFDSLLARIAEITIDKPDSNYPPYNIRRLDKFNYIVEIALAGFNKTDINIKVADDTLTVKSIKKEKTEFKDSDESLVHKGISQRSFTRHFALADDTIVKDAKLDNGLLSIYIEKILPEEKRPKEIKIK
jgi:molecular chaperone IbpA